MAHSKTDNRRQALDNHSKRNARRAKNQEHYLANLALARLIAEHKGQS